MNVETVDDVEDQEEVSDPIITIAHRRMRRERRNFEAEEMNDGEYSCGDQSAARNNYM